MENRAGTFISQPSGYKTFKPKPLPPIPTVSYDSEMIELLSRADRMLGRLDGVTETLPDPELFVAMYVQKEAVLSSQIEGTQASLVDVFDGDQTKEKREDIGDIINYVGAMNYGLERLKEFPLSLRLLREIHQVLLSSGRGSKRSPGEFRTSQNWIGGNSLMDAKFIPPHHDFLNILMGDLENFLNNPDLSLPTLMKIAIAHYQFETIHPFLDGNGRIGRLLITLFLVQERILDRPLLYLSTYFEKRKDLYYDNLNEIRTKNDLKQWIKYFLVGIEQTASQASQTLYEILRFKEDIEHKIQREYGRRNHQAITLLHELLKNPFTTVEQAASICGITYKAANELVKKLCGDDILVEITGKNRNRLFVFEKYLNIVN